MTPPHERDLIRLDGHAKIYDRRKILFVLLIPLAMVLMAVSSTNVALPSIQFGLHASEADLQWVLSGYALSYGIVLVPAGRTGDVIGRGRLFIIGVCLFTLASLSCGLAPNPAFLITSRAIQGLGSGLTSPQITGMITQYFSGQGRAKAFALFGVVVSASVAVAPMFTGIIIAAIGPALGWRASFIVNVAFGVLAVALAARWFPFETERLRRNAKQSGQAVRTHVDLDPVGALLLATAVLTCMLPFAIRKPAFFGLLAFSGVLVWAWLTWEVRYKARGRAPLVDLSLFSYRSFSYSTAISTLMFLSSPPIFVILAIYLQRALGESALTSGLAGLPNAIISGILAFVAGRYALSRGRNLVIAGLIIIIAGVAGAAFLVYAFGTQVSVVAIAAAIGVMGIGQGIMGSVNQTLSLSEVPPASGGTAGGIKQTGERVATGMGQTIFTAIFFGIAAHDWSRGFFQTYLASCLVMATALALAIRDRKLFGSGVPLATRT